MYTFSHALFSPSKTFRIKMDCCNVTRTKRNNHDRGAIEANEAKASHLKSRSEFFQTFFFISMLRGPDSRSIKLTSSLLINLTFSVNISSVTALLFFLKDYNYPKFDKSVLWGTTKDEKSLLKYKEERQYIVLCARTNLSIHYAVCTI